MSFSATVFNVLIASPSDVPEERKAISQTLYEWNALHSQATQKVFLPVRWETHSAPQMGDRPQALINNQVVKGCDMLIGAFWTRLGSPTGVEASGTVEEIKWFLSQKKPVMLYFSKARVDLDKMDIDQIKSLKEFRASIRDRGIQGEYSSIDELRENLTRQLTIVAREMSTGPVIDKRIVREAHESLKDAFVVEAAVVAAPASPARTPGTTRVEDPIYLQDYTEKAFVVRGNTTAYRQALKDAGGRWIPLKTGGKGWMFSKRHLKDVSGILGVPPELAANR